MKCILQLQPLNDRAIQNKSEPFRKSFRSKPKQRKFPDLIVSDTVQQQRLEGNKMCAIMVMKTQCICILIHIASLSLPSYSYLNEVNSLQLVKCVPYSFGFGFNFHTFNRFRRLLVSVGYWFSCRKYVKAVAEKSKIHRIYFLFS